MTELVFAQYGFEFGTSNWTWGFSVARGLESGLDNVNELIVKGSKSYYYSYTTQHDQILNPES